MDAAFMLVVLVMAMCALGIAFAAKWDNERLFEKYGKAKCFAEVKNMPGLSCDQQRTILQILDLKDATGVLLQSMTEEAGLELCVLCDGLPIGTINANNGFPRRVEYKDIVQSKDK